jgi:hypothetical protein
MPQTLNVGARSVFVTSVAWIFMLLALLAVVAAGVRLASAQSLLVAVSPTHGLSGLLASYLPWAMAGALALSLAIWGAALGLLLRLDWARRAFIGLLLVAIAVNLAGLWLQHELVESVVSQTLSRTPLPSPALGVFGGFVTASRVLATVTTLGACAVLGLIVRRLASPAVRQEFV